MRVDLVVIFILVSGLLVDIAITMHSTVLYLT